MASRKVADFYAKRAKELGYAARSAFKLLEMHEKFNVVKGSVLDLGTHPGAWLQVVSKTMAPDAFALGVDLQETRLEGMKHVDASRVRAVQRDVFDLDDREIASLRRHLGKPGGSFGTVLSDLAPSTTGSKAIDAARSYALAEHAVRLALGERALDVLDDDDASTEHVGRFDGKENDREHRDVERVGGVLRLGGNLVIKLLEGPGGGRADLQAACKPHFTAMKWFRPKATRNESTEVFLIARGRKKDARFAKDKSVHA
jgi:23S rRNA U2552 (ribose-2'-O)-methylase RlmE/FtsJ